MSNDFGWALAAMKNGHEVRRVTDEHPAWSDVKVGLAGPHDHLTLPYLYINGIAGTFPWTPGQWDLLAEDWVLADA